jgi:putative NADH-flavin reductase
MNGDSLEAALSGAECVISALGTKLSRKPTTLLSHGTRNLVSAMRHQGVGRVICVTGIGAGDSKGHGGWLYDRIIQPLLLNEIYKDKTRQEQVVRDSGLDWVIVRPAQLTNGPATGSYRVQTEMINFTSTKISRADVAEFLLAQVSQNTYLGKAPVITY